MEKVVGAADKAIELAEEPDKNAYILKMSSYVERKQYANAKDVAEVILKLFPEDSRNWIQLGFYYMQLEDYPKALSTFELAHNQGYLTKESQLKALAQLYGTNEIPHRAALIQEKYIGSGMIKRNKDTLSALANSWHQARDYRKAAKYYGEAAALAKDASLYKKQGSLLLSAEDYKGAEAALKKALELGIESEGQTHVELMQAHFYQNDLKQAYQAMQAAKQHSSSARTARSWESYIKKTAENRGISI
jgi:tetratricopeptide (TPR) repeat protein